MPPAQPWIRGLALPTPRLAGLVALGCLPLVALLRHPALLVVCAGYNLLLALATLADLWASAGADRFSVERRAPVALSYGARAVSTPRIGQSGSRTVRIRIREDRSPALGDADAAELVLAPGAAAEVKLPLRPTKRGDHELRGITLRWPTPLGLFERQAHWPLLQPVRVYPDLRALQRSDLAQRAGRLLEAGLRTARLRGAGTEFESLREYQPDDEYRRIHWGATARRGKLVSRLYEVERRQTVILCLDIGRLMCAKIDDATRLDHAIRAALMLADIALRLHDQVGLLIFAEEPLAYLPPRPGRAQLHRLLEALYNVEGRLIEPGYGAAFRLLGMQQRKRAMVVLFTDLVDANASEAMLTYATALRPAHLPLVVGFNDPHLLALADQPPDTAADLYERAIAASRLADRADALAKLRANGLRVVDAPPEQAAVALVNRYLEMKVKLLL